MLPTKVAKVHVNITGSVNGSAGRLRSNSSSAVENRRVPDHHKPAVGAKHHTSAITHGIELPEPPPQPIFSRFCVEMPQYGRTVLSGCCAPEILERLPGAHLGSAVVGPLMFPEQLEREARRTASPAAYFHVCSATTVYVQMPYSM